MAEERQLLADAVLEDREVLLEEVAHVTVPSVGDRHVEVDHLDPHLEGRGPGGRTGRSLGRGQERDEYEGGGEGGARVHELRDGWDRSAP